MYFVSLTEWISFSDVLKSIYEKEQSKLKTKMIHIRGRWFHILYLECNTLTLRYSTMVAPVKYKH